MINTPPPRHGTIALLVLMCSGAAGAQDRPFVFSIATFRPTAAARATTLRVDYDVGGGERMFQQDRGDSPEQQVTVQAARGRFLMIGRMNLVSSAGAFETASSGEVLVSVRPGGRTGVALAAGGGMLHEAGGTNVLLARMTGSHEDEAWRLHANVLMQKPFDAARDAMDLITTVGWARRLTPAFALGVEGVAEDLEGFWDSAEAEGGARILIGPSLHVAPAGRSWQVVATGGPTFHPADTGRSTAAIRELPPARDRYGFAVKLGVTYRMF
jgi:hypothetical protein